VFGFAEPVLCFEPPQATIPAIEQAIKKIMMTFFMVILSCTGSITLPLRHIKASVQTDTIFYYENRCTSNLHNEVL
jgi:hypothetical protein